MKHRFTLLFIVIASFIFNPAILAQKKITEITSSDFKNQIWNFEANQNEFIFKGKKPVIISFHKQKNGLCETMASMLEEVRKEHKNRFDVYLINADEIELIQLFQIQKYPTLLLIPAKEEPQVYEGFKTKNELSQLIESTFKK